MKLTDIILSEEQGPKQRTVDLKTLSYDLLISMFGTRPMFGFSLPNPDDSTRQVFDQNSLDNWKSGIEKRYGNVILRIDTEAKNPWEKIQILDDKFRSDKEDRVAGKAAWLDKERAAGRTSGLD